MNRVGEAPFLYFLFFYILCAANNIKKPISHPQATAPFAEYWNVGRESEQANVNARLSERKTPRSYISHASASVSVFCAIPLDTNHYSQVYTHVFLTKTGITHAFSASAYCKHTIPTLKASRLFLTNGENMFFLLFCLEAITNALSQAISGY